MASRAEKGAAGARRCRRAVGHAWSRADALDNSGAVVGDSYPNGPGSRAFPGNTARPRHAYLWQYGTMTDIAGQWRQTINDQGQITCDRAFGSGRLATIVQDLPSIAIYFAVAVPIVL